MFYNSLLNKVVSRMNNRPMLKYVYQNPENGEWVASDGHIMLIEHNEAIPMFKFWNPETGNPVDEKLQYLDYEFALKGIQAQIKGKFTGKISRVSDNLSKMGDVYVDSDLLDVALEFVGPEHTINVPDTSGYGIYIHNNDKSRQALVVSINPKESYRVLDLDGETIFRFDTYKQARDFVLSMGNDFIVRK